MRTDMILFTSHSRGLGKGSAPSAWVSEFIRDYSPKPNRRMALSPAMPNIPTSPDEAP